MFCPEEDLCIDSESEVTNPEAQHPMSPTIVRQTTIINVSNGANVHLQVGHNNQQHQSSQSLEDLTTVPCCGNCGSTNSSPVATISRSHSVEYLDSDRDCGFSPTQDRADTQQGLVDSLRQRFESSTINAKASSPVVIQRKFRTQTSSNSQVSFNNSFQEDLETDMGPGWDLPEEQGDFRGYTCVESDNSSNCGSDLTAESSDLDNTLPRRSDPPVLPKRRAKVGEEKQKSAIQLDDEDYVSMTGSSGSLNEPMAQSIDTSTDKKDEKSRSSAGKNPIPKHKIDEAQATLGFRSDVNGELKRVRRILRPYKSRDGYYVLWQFSDYALSLSVTFLQDIKNFAVIYDRADQSWLILKNGPRNTSLSTLMKLYIKNRIRLPLSKGQTKGVKLALTPQNNQPSLAKQMARNISFGSAETKPPPLPPRRASAPLLIPSGSPLLPPKPQGFLTLIKPVIQNDNALDSRLLH